MNEYFLSYALREDVHLYSQFITTNRPYTRATENFIAGVTYIPVKGVLVGFRADRGSTKLFFDQDEYVLNAWQLVANTKTFSAAILGIDSRIPLYRLRGIPLFSLGLCNCICIINPMEALQWMF